MIRLKLLGFAALSSVLLTAPAQASVRASDSGARKIMRDFARCTVKYEHRLAQQYVLMNPSDRLPEDEFRKVADGTCLGFLGGRLKMRPFQYRAALAEELIRRDLKGRSGFDLASVPPLEWRDPDTTQVAEFSIRPAAEWQREDQFAAETYVSQLGECTVRANPAGARAVIEAKSESDEIAAMQAIGPQIANCVQAGETLKFDRTILRSAIALSYYRLAMASASASQQAAAQ
ncbi:MAG TPA: hypothetical protein VFR92_06435 [Sphingomicrobium sp.]|jgi:hypothetical protein|nr:hypothetical protein [Sphingomicrobium sp.]